MQQQVLDQYPITPKKESNIQEAGETYRKIFA